MNEIKISKLQYPDTIRHNVSMYLGDVNNFTNPFRELINNAEDEVLNGYASYIRIINDETHKCVIENGRGMPVYADPDYPDQIITHEIVTGIHVGSKLDNTDEVTSGVHGIGASATNAVSERFAVAVNLNKKELKTTLKWIREKVKKGKLKNPIMYIEYAKGVLVEEAVFDGVHHLSGIWNGVEVPEDFSTAVFVVPDATLYKSTKVSIAEFPLKLIVSMKDADITVNGEKVLPFDFKTDIVKENPLFLDEIIDFNFPINKYISITGNLAYDKEDMRYSHKTIINLIENNHGGFIERKLNQSLGRILHKMNPIVKAQDSILGLIIFSNTSTALKMSFSSQTKERLVAIGNTNVSQVREILKSQGVKDSKIDGEILRYHLPDGYLEARLDEFFTKLVKKNQKYFTALCGKIIEYHMQMRKLSNTDFIKSKVILGDEDRRRSMSGESAKVYEASSENSHIRELYIVEGLSAASPIIKSRNLKTQSILPLRGKLINSAAMDTSELVESPELLGIINTIGCGVGGMVNVEKSRYGKIIIATDLDVDGSHIANLITAVFIIHAPELIKAGMLYKVEAPYYYDKTINKYYHAEEKDKINFDNKIEKRKGLGSYTDPEVEKFLVGNDRELIQISYPDDESKMVDAVSLLYSGSARRDLMVNSGVLVLPEAAVI